MEDTPPGAEMEPAIGLMQDDDPSAFWNQPVGQVRHDADAKVFSENLPGEQGRQAAEPMLDEYQPSGHQLHVQFP